jgi:hypothetical protein
MERFHDFERDIVKISRAKSERIETVEDGGMNEILSEAEGFIARLGGYVKLRSENAYTAPRRQPISRCPVSTRLCARFDALLIPRSVYRLTSIAVKQFT